MSQLTKSFQEERNLRKFSKLKASHSAFKTAELKSSATQNLPENDITIMDGLVFLGITGLCAAGIVSFIFTFLILGYILTP